MRAHTKRARGEEYRRHQVFKRTNRWINAIKNIATHPPVFLHPILSLALSLLSITLFVVVFDQICYLRTSITLDLNRLWVDNDNVSCVCICLCFSVRSLVLAIVRLFHDAYRIFGGSFCLYFWTSYYCSGRGIPSCCFTVNGQMHLNRREKRRITNNKTHSRKIHWQIFKKRNRIHISHWHLHKFTLHSP